MAEVRVQTTVIGSHPFPGCIVPGGDLPDRRAVADALWPIVAAELQALVDGALEVRHSL